MWTIARVSATAIFILIFMVSNPNQVRAKAYFSAKAEMIENSEVIAVVNIEKVSTIEKTGTSQTYMKEGDAVVERRLKGEIPSRFKLYGCENLRCARSDFVPGKYLVFLSKDGELWIGSNYHFSIRPIKDGQTEWYSSDGVGPLTFVASDKVIAELKTEIGDPNKLSTLKAPLKVLAEAKVLEDQIIGEAPGPSPTQKAFAEAKKSCLNDSSQLQTLSKYGTPAGKIYASLLMMETKNSEEGKKLLATLSHCRSTLDYKSGCRMTTAGVWQIAGELYSIGHFLNLKVPENKKIN